MSLKAQGGVRSFECQLCYVKFPSAPKLLEHAKHHQAGESAVNCKYCGMAFFSTLALNRHKWSAHLRPKNFVCPICNKGFEYNTQLLRHTSVHTGIKTVTPRSARTSSASNNISGACSKTEAKNKFVCETCGKPFASSSRYREHLLDRITDVETGLLVCNTIGKRHYVGVKDRPSFMCELCGQNIGSETLLNVHKRESHSIADEPVGIGNVVGNSSNYNDNHGDTNASWMAQVPKRRSFLVLPKIGVQSSPQFEAWKKREERPGSDKCIQKSAEVIEVTDDESDLDLPGIIVAPVTEDEQAEVNSFIVELESGGGQLKNAEGCLEDCVKLEMV